MPLEWSPALAVGIEEIDAQHRELFRRAGRLLEALRGGRADEVDALVQYLHGYAVTHFGAEEATMREVGYPGYVRHKTEHDRFIADLLDVAEDLDERGNAAVAPRVEAWLTAWLREHVEGTDAELGRFLARKRVPAAKA